MHSAYDFIMFNFIYVYTEQEQDSNFHTSLVHFFNYLLLHPSYALFIQQEKFSTRYTLGHITPFHRLLIYSN